MSIGYGRDEAGLFKHNFGPLNKYGGERRLNVLITRARERCVVFSNFRADDLRIDVTTPQGVKVLKIFLEYAETGNLPSSITIQDDTDSPFEDSVHEFLREHGYEVHKQVGCAGFRIDLAITDPNALGRYLLGIECDGAQYHSSRVARERDRLRQQILEGLKWRIYRVWSTDWYRNRRDCEAKLLAAVEQARHEESLVSSSPISLSNFSAKASSDRGPLEQAKISEIDVLKDTSDKENPEYETCSSLGIRIAGELHEQSLDDLSTAVIKMVEIEGPIHFEELVARIRSLWGLKKAGDRIRGHIKKAAKMAERYNEVRWDGEFLWPAKQRKLLVRRRSKPNIEWICDEEIAEGAKLVLKRQFSTSMEDLVIQSSRMLGYQATSEVVKQRIRDIISQLLKTGELQQMPNGMIDVVQ